MTDGSVPLAPRQAAAILRAMARSIRVELSALPEAALRWHPGPGEWCVLEALGHLIEAEERGFSGRVRSILAEDEPAFATWDPPAVARERRDCERNPMELLAEFEARRAASVELVSSLAETDLARAGRHPEVGRLRIADLLHEWVHHDRNHVRQMLANVQAYVWPHMGNAQRFIEPSPK
jgi:hypothetical protein